MALRSSLLDQNTLMGMSSLIKVAIICGHWVTPLEDRVTVLLRNSGVAVRVNYQHNSSLREGLLAPFLLFPRYLCDFFVCQTFFVRYDSLFDEFQLQFRLVSHSQ